MTIEDTPKLENPVEELKQEFSWSEWKKIGDMYWSAHRDVQDFVFGRGFGHKESRQELEEKEAEASRVMSEYLEKYAVALEEIDLSEVERRTVPTFTHRGGGEKYLVHLSSKEGGFIDKEFVLDPKEFVKRLREFRKGLGARDDEYIDAFRGKLWKDFTYLENLRGDDKRILLNSDDIGFIAIKI